MSEEEQKIKQEIKEKQLVEVHAKIATKKQKKKHEEDKLAKELREIKIKR